MRILYVGNLPENTSNEQLKEIFSHAGKVVDATVVTDKFSGKSKGFGFIEMATEEEAHTAIKTFNKKGIQKTELIVCEAKPTKPA